MRALRWLLLALVLQVAAWLYVWITIQAWDERFLEGMLNRDRTALTVDRTIYRHEPVSSQFIRFDLKQRTWKWISRRAWIVELPECPPDEQLWELKGPFKQRGRYRAELFDRDTHATIISREIEMPLSKQYSPSLHANRFLVDVRDSSVLYLDLANPDSKFELLSFATRSGSGSNDIHIPYGQMQLIVETYPTRAHAGIPPTQLDRFCFLSNGKLEHVRSWQTHSPGMTKCWRDLMVTIPLDTKQIELRSLSTDEVVQRGNYPPQFDPSRGCNFHLTPEGPVLVYVTKTGTSEWDPIRERALPAYTSATLTDLQFGSLADGSLQIYRLATGVEVWDPQLHKTLFHLPSSYKNVCLLDSDTLLYTTGEYGISFYYYDIPSGRCTGCWRPFVVVPWLCLTLLLGFAVWAYQWTQASARVGWSPWLDTLLVLWLPVYACLLFGSERQMGYKGSNWLTSMGLGVSTGALAAAACYAMLSRDSLWKRYRPLLFLEMANGLILWLVPISIAPVYRPLQILWIQHFPLCLLMLTMQGLRMFSLRLDTSEGNRIVAGGDRPQLTDYFLLTFCVAVAFWLYNLVNLILPVSQVSIRSTEGLIYALSLLVMTSCGLAKSAWLFRIGQILAGVILVALLVDAMLRWTFGLDVARMIGGEALRIDLALAAVALVSCIPLRARGVRWAGHFCLRRCFCQIGQKD